MGGSVHIIVNLSDWTMVHRFPARPVGTSHVVWVAGIDDGTGIHSGDTITAGTHSRSGGWTLIERDQSRALQARGGAVTVRATEWITSGTVSLDSAISGGLRANPIHARTLHRGVVRAAIGKD